MGTEGKEDPRSVEELIGALSDESDEVRGDAASALTDFQDERAITPLLKALKDPYPMVRECAAFALGEYKREEHVEPLIEVLKDEVAEPRWAAAWALGTIGDPRAVKPLIVALNDTDKSVRQAAARSLGEIGDPKAVKPLIVAMEDENEYVRESSAESLGKLNDRGAIDSLINHLHDDFDLTRNASAKSLGKLDPSRARKEVMRAIDFRIDNSVAKREIKRSILFTIIGGFLGALVMMPTVINSINDILSFLSLDQQMPFWLGFIISYLIVALIFTAIVFLFLLIMENWILYSYGILLDDGFYYDSDDLYEVIDKNIKKRYEKQDVLKEGVRFLVTSPNGKTYKINILINDIYRKSDDVIYVNNGKKLDPKNRDFIIKAIKESVLEYLIKPNED